MWCKEVLTGRQNTNTKLMFYECYHGSYYRCMYIPKQSLPTNSKMQWPLFNSSLVAASWIYLPGHAFELSVSWMHDWSEFATPITKGAKQQEKSESSQVFTVYFHCKRGLRFIVLNTVTTGTCMRYKELIYSSNNL